MAYSFGVSVGVAPAGAGSAAWRAAMASREAWVRPSRCSVPSTCVRVPSALRTWLPPVVGSCGAVAGVVACLFAEAMTVLSGERVLGGAVLHVERPGEGGDIGVGAIAVANDW